jgi:hypothetical protein
MKDIKYIEIPNSKSKTTKIIFGCIVFVIISIWMWTYAETQTSHSPIALKIYSVIGISFFGSGLILGLIKLFDKRPGLIIDKEGIQNYMSISKGIFVSWKDIDRFETIRIASTKILLVFVCNPDKIIASESKWKQKIMKNNYRKHGTPITLGSGTLQIDFDELLEILNEGLIKFKNN